MYNGMNVIWYIGSDWFATSQRPSGDAKVSFSFAKVFCKHHHARA